MSDSDLEITGEPCAPPLSREASFCSEGGTSRSSFRSEGAPRYPTLSRENSMDSDVDLRSYQKAPLTPTESKEELATVPEEETMCGYSWDGGWCCALWLLFFGGAILVGVVFAVLGVQDRWHKNGVWDRQVGFLEHFERADVACAKLVTVNPTCVDRNLPNCTLAEAQHQQGFCCQDDETFRLSWVHCTIFNATFFTNVHPEHDFVYVKKCFSDLCTEKTVQYFTDQPTFFVWVHFHNLAWFRFRGCVGCISAVGRGFAFFGIAYLAIIPSYLIGFGVFGLVFMCRLTVKRCFNKI